MDCLIYIGNKDRVIINYPGTGGSKNGYNDKYVKIANSLLDLGTVVCLDNQHISYDERTLTKQLEDAILELTYTFGPKEIYLMGASAGASAIACSAYRFDLVKKILLVCPSQNCNTDNIRYFDGEVSILTGLDDEIVGLFPLMLPRCCISAKTVKLHAISGCNHQFHGTLNGKYMSMGPRWAFNNENLDPEKGIELY